MNKHFIPLIYICKCTGLTILCNKNPTFFLYFMIQFQLLDTEKSIIFQPSYENRCQISVLNKLHLTRKSKTSIRFVEITYFVRLLTENILSNFILSSQDLLTKN